jgi:hypothetical protein
MELLPHALEKACHASVHVVMAFGGVKLRPMERHNRYCGPSEKLRTFSIYVGSPSFNSTTIKRSLAQAGPTALLSQSWHSIRNLSLSKPPTSSKVRCVRLNHFHSLSVPGMQMCPYFGSIQTYPVLRNNASGPENGLPRRISAGF